MSDFLLLATIILVAGIVAVPIATRLKLGSVLGYLIAGIAISPLLSLLGVDVVSLQHFAEFGVVMMLFLVGLELEPKLLWQMRNRLMGLGGGQVMLTVLLVMAVAMAFGQSWNTGLVIGMILCLSSTAIVLQTLNEKGLMKSDGGQASFSVLLFQDIAFIPMLAIIPLLAFPETANLTAGGAEESHTLSLVEGLNGWQTMLVTIGAIAAVILGGNYLTRPIFRFVAGANLRELFTASALLLVIGIALLMTLVGLSPALGTFLAGVVLANSEYKHELESDIDPFRGLLLGLFFITVGAGIDFSLLSANFSVVISMTIGLMLLKATVLFLLGTAFKIRGAQRWLFTLGVAQAGEFGFVLLAFTTANGALPQDIADLLLLVVALSMLITPLLFILYDQIVARRYSKGQEQEADAIAEENGIIIAGRGRMGGIVDRMLRTAGYPSTVIDYSSKQLDILRKYGISHAYFGDATRPDLLHAAGIEKAKLLIVTIDDRHQITELVSYAIRNYPDLHVIARSVDRHHTYELWAHGCRDIIRETYDSSLRIGRSAYEALGTPREAAEEMKQAFHEMDQQSMIEVADVFDINIPGHENEAYVAKVRDRAESWEAELHGRMMEIMDGKTEKA
ncbi:MAG: monovalent cation:proton antiporter-2 (CPA2) family protein [Hyphomonadaceae bacterium]|nr:monovalent cation:proton antiporter-2 (CPA2) family protein [Hyphomonadaceae bacterium]